MKLHRIPSLMASALISFAAASHAQSLVDIQFGGNDYGSAAPLQTGSGLAGAAGDYWNDFTSDSDLLSGVNLYDSTDTPTGATLTVVNPTQNDYEGNAYMYADTGSGSNHLVGTSIENLTDAEFGVGGPSLAFNFTGLTPNEVFDIYMYSAPDRWERSSYWAVGSGSTSLVGPLNSYYTGQAPTTPVLGINYLLLTGTTDGSGNLTINATQNSGDIDTNGFQLQAVANVPEPSIEWGLAAGGVLLAFRRRRTWGFNSFSRLLRDCGRS